MFTGIIECKGIINKITISETGGRIYIGVFPDDFILKKGESIAVDGVCLTVSDVKERTFKASVSRETLERTTFRYKKKGDEVNIERALKISDRVGGHILLGHVDGVGEVLYVGRSCVGMVMDIKIPEELCRYVVEKGSIGIDGISLTVASIKGDIIRIALIPYTIEQTTIGKRHRGEKVNIEVDIIGKYIYRFVNDYLQKDDHPRIDYDFLKGKGFL